MQLITVILGMYRRSRLTSRYSVQMPCLLRIWSLLFITVAAVTTPSAAFCEMRDFIPRLIDYNGELDFFALRQTNENKTSGSKVSTTDTYFVEQLKLDTSGFVYHPAFITFTASGAVGLLQDKFQSDNTASPWNNSNANEYSLSAHVLPEKPYTLDLLTSRTEAFASTGSFTNVHPVIYLNSAMFTYRGSPIGFTTSYTNTRIISDTTTDSGVYTAQVTHSLRHSSTSIGLTRSDTTSNAGTTYDQSYYFLSNQLQFERLSFIEQLLLRSDLKYDTYEQSDPIQITRGRDNSWIEYLQLNLPWRFQSNSTYSRIYSASKSDPTSASVTSEQSRQSNSNDSINEVLMHRLGDSLFSSYIYNNSKNNSSGGQSDNVSNSLNFMYTKKIPWGIFTAGATGTILDTNNTGSVTTLNEVHQSKANGIDFFSLQQGLIDPSTIVVDLVAPNTGIRYQLINNVNYVITQIGNTFRITVQSFFLFPVPGFTPNPDINFVYTFNVTYLSTQGTFDIKTRTIGYNFGLSLFNNLLNPYYSYQTSDQTLVSGFFPGELSNYTVNTAGITVQRAPFRLWTEYQKYDSNINPSSSWRSRLDFHENVFQSLSVGAGLFYNVSHYLQSQSSIGLTSPYTETVRGATVSVQKIFPWHLNLSGAGYYAQTTGRTDSNAYSLNGLLTWRLGRLSVDAQATYQLVESLANNARQTTSQTVYLLKLRRQLF